MAMCDMQPQLLFVRDLKRMFPGLGADTIYALLNSGEVAAQKVGIRWVTTPQAVEAWVGAHRLRQCESTDAESGAVTVSILPGRDDCRCAKRGGRKHSVWRIRPYLGRDATGRQQFGRSRTMHGSKREANRLAHEADQEIRGGSCPGASQPDVGALPRAMVAR